jgi:hypothetical protein
LLSRVPRSKNSFLFRNCKLLSADFKHFLAETPRI